MTDKSAIERMKEYAESWLDMGIEYSRGQIIEAMVNKAREFAAEEKSKPAPVEAKATGETSDGYHTFNELYDHRIALYLTISNTFPSKFWKSKKHEDGSCFDGWFILGGNLGTGDISYHLPMDKWDMANCQELPLGKKWDGHTAADVVERLLRYRPASPAVEELVKELKGWWDDNFTTIEFEDSLLGEIAKKYTGGK